MARRPPTPATDRFGWHPEPELVGTTDPAARASLERLGAAGWTAALDYLFDEALRRPTTPETYPELRRAFFGETGRPAAAPADPRPAADVLAEFTRRLAPHGFNSQHPAQFAYFTPPPLWLSIVGELLAQVTNQGIDVWHSGPAGAFVEEEVIAWLTELVGFGPGSFGVLTSGGVMANVMALAVARDIHLQRLFGRPPEAAPPRGADLEGLRVYASDQAHFSIARGLDLLGFPATTLRVVMSDERFRLRGEPVAEAIAADRSAGRRPLAIAAVAGSTNTGSVDAMGELADLAGREGLWLHVDAAYGGGARLSATEAHRVPELERADSLTIDPHKWFFQAYDIGALLVRRRADLLGTFHREPEYYRVSDATSAGGPDTADESREPLHWYQHSMEGSRRFRALKLWLSWKHLGSDGLGRLVEANLALAGYLAGRIAACDDFEALPPEPELSVVCFRHLPGGRPAETFEPAALDRHQDALQRALEVSGEAWVSTTRLRGRTWLRAGIVNYLATEADVDRLLDALRRLSPTAAAAAGNPAERGEGDAEEG